MGHKDHRPHNPLEVAWRQLSSSSLALALVLALVLALGQALEQAVLKACKNHRSQTHLCRRTDRYNSSRQNSHNLQRSHSYLPFTLRCFSLLIRCGLEH